jgi:two-component system sensor histidine kinase UhpB
MSRLWREAHPEVTIRTTISPALEPTGETAELTIYRMVQEALTNVFRHAGATSVDVTIEPAEPHGSLRQQRARVRVRDNGRGINSGQSGGFGLVGMRERILALGGSLDVASSEHGVTVEALIPTAVA